MRRPDISRLSSPPVAWRPAAIPAILLLIAGLAGGGDNFLAAAAAGREGGGAASPGETSDAFRPFTPDSYWNTPIPPDAPIDPNSALYIEDAKDPVRSTPLLGLTGAPGVGQRAGQKYSVPVYWSKPTDTLYTINPLRWGKLIQVRIPSGATPQAGSDRSIWIFDLPGGQIVQLWKTTYYSNTNTWTANSTSRYIIDSDGLDRRAGSNNQLNGGHRGVPPHVQVVRLDQVRAGAIEHRLACYWHDTGRPNASTPWYYWPMVGYEPKKGGIVPEGIVLRIKPAVDVEIRKLSRVALVVARALQKYGCIIGDNSGKNFNRVKLERNLDAWRDLDPALTRNALKDLPWDDWEFVKGGYDPR